MSSVPPAVSLAHPATTTATVVLDTSVLVADPGALTAFATCAIKIPLTVIEELDGLKNRPDGVGQTAREALRRIEALRVAGGGSLLDPVPLPQGRTVAVLLNGINHTPLDEHYFAVMMHKGISGDLKRLSFGDLATLLTCQTTTVHHMIAEHIVSGGARGGCKFCNGASRELKALIVEERSKNRSEEPFSLFIAVSAIASQKRRLDNRMGRSLRLPARPRFSA